MRNRKVLPLLLTVLAVLGLLAIGGPGILGQLTDSTTPGGSVSAMPVPGAATSPTAQDSPAAGSGKKPTPQPHVRDNPSGLPEVRESALPAEGRRTLALIRAGGPYLYRQDDQTFGNFERILPRRERGYYREYTVPTPGESDRGARRIVAGDDGGKYYTDDHYETFRFIVEGS